MIRYCYVKIRVNRRLNRIISVLNMLHEPSDILHIYTGEFYHVKIRAEEIGFLFDNKFLFIDHKNVSLGFGFGQIRYYW